MKVIHCVTAGVFNVGLGEVALTSSNTLPPKAPKKPIEKNGSTSLNTKPYSTFPIFFKL